MHIAILHPLTTTPQSLTMALSQSFTGGSEMVTEQRDVTLSVEFFAPGRAVDTWRNRDDGTHFAVGLVSPASSSDDALQQFVTTWESEYGRQYTRAVVNVKSAC